MSNTISFSVTDDQLALIEYEAVSKGLTRSQFAKTALFSHMNKYPAKGIMAQLAELLPPTPTNLGPRGNSTEDRDED